IHWLFIAAQAALEAGWKLSDINNLFGITKGTSWTGETKLCLTREVFSVPDRKFILPEKVVSVTPLSGGRYDYRLHRLFRVYPNLEACLDDHLAILRKSGYADAWPRTGRPERVCPTHCGHDRRKVCDRSELCANDGGHDQYGEPDRGGTVMN
ncbi:MAG: hypothetical protein LBD27_04820, partial [Tannerella sp.]|nr:hypothetical protein [Tannerella sp.]